MTLGSDSRGKKCENEPFSLMFLGAFFNGFFDVASIWLNIFSLFFTRTCMVHLRMSVPNFGSKSCNGPEIWAKNRDWVQKKRVLGFFD